MFSNWKKILAVPLILAISHTKAWSHPTRENLTNPNETGGLVAQFPSQSQFFFGLANAPAHVEDDLQDTWLSFARSGNVAAFLNQARPEDRLRFWSTPEVELDLAADSGVRLFRMGIDWGRLVPLEPGSNNVPICQGICGKGVQDHTALAKYRSIIQAARRRGMAVMLTLFHHSLPAWAAARGGWQDDLVRESFVAFGQDLTDALAAEVDHWIPLNEPTIFSFLTHIAGIWPPGHGENHQELLSAAFLRGKYWAALKNMQKAHGELYRYIHANDTVIADPWVSSSRPALVGVAHFVSVNVPVRFDDRPTKAVADSLLKFRFLDRLFPHLDFIGINYYGTEFIRGTAPTLEAPAEYSDSGKAINPLGLQEILKEFHIRYNVKKVARAPDAQPLPFVITENGIADSTDILRPAYLIEHLIAVHRAREEGIPVRGYIHWTVSDNWEWADGYCPQFGLVSVDREDNLKRTKRESFHLYQKIVQSGVISEQQRNAAWERITKVTGKPRPMCRAANGRSSLDSPSWEKVFTGHDWRMPPQNSSANEFSPNRLTRFQTAGVEGQE